ncbi:MAG: hypothetical protein IPL53_05655 [Ignavibacteria bacterium]|nr:hypothetical protein [Ignavibacteria bacterium]
MVEIDGVWSMIKGDLNQDGFIDLTDYLLLYNAVANFENKYDIDCSGFTDLTDLVILKDYLDKFITVIKP